MTDHSIKKNLNLSFQRTKVFLMVLSAILILIYILSGIYSISTYEVGVLQRFGRITDSSVMPGIHYTFPRPFGLITKVPLKKVHRIILEDFSENSAMANTFRELTGLNSYCITGDNNTVNLICVLQYTISEPVDYLFRINNIEQALKNMAASTIIHTLASMPVDEILTYGKPRIENGIKQELQKRLDDMRTGFSITFVELREVRPPGIVQSNFDDVINSQIDKKKYITTAESYRNEQIMEANAQANRTLQEANAYKHKVVAEASGETERFLKQADQAGKSLTIAKRQMYMQFVRDIWPKIMTKYVVEPGAAENIRLRIP